jgi:hypothetical protein
MGKALIPVCLAENLNACSGNMDKNGPFMLLHTVGQHDTAPRGSNPLS